VRIRRRSSNLEGNTIYNVLSYEKYITYTSKYECNFKNY
jgi:hypothetical protein